jgi:hypothetical protein
MSNPSLFPKPEREPPRLSSRFGNGEYRAGPGITVKWTRRTLTTRADCDECTALQHETDGDYWPRRQVRHRRTMNGTRLDLCNAHTAAWKDRDALDGAD